MTAPGSGLDETAWAEFARVAERFGHDPGRLAAGEEVLGEMRVMGPEMGRKLFCHATDAVREARLASFFQPPIAARARLGQGMHDRGEAAVFAALKPAEGFADRRGLARHYPLHARTISIVRKHLAPGEIWDV